MADFVSDWDCSAVSYPSLVFEQSLAPEAAEKRKGSKKFEVPSSALLRPVKLPKPPGLVKKKKKKKKRTQHAEQSTAELHSFLNGYKGAWQKPEATGSEPVPQDSGIEKHTALAVNLEGQKQKGGKPSPADANLQVDSSKGCEHSFSKVAKQQDKRKRQVALNEASDAGASHVHPASQSKAIDKGVTTVQQSEQLAAREQTQPSKRAKLTIAGAVQILSNQARMSQSQQAAAGQPSHPTQQPQGKQPSKQRQPPAVQPVQPPQQPQGEQPSKKRQPPAVQPVQPPQQPQGEQPSKKRQPPAVQPVQPPQQPQGEQPSKKRQPPAVQPVQPPQQPQGEQPSKKRQPPTVQPVQPPQQPQNKQPSKKRQPPAVQPVQPPQQPQSKQPSKTQQPPAVQPVQPPQQPQITPLPEQRQQPPAAQQVAALAKQRQAPVAQPSQPSPLPHQQQKQGKMPFNRLPSDAEQPALPQSRLPPVPQPRPGAQLSPPSSAGTALPHSRVAPIPLTRPGAQPSPSSPALAAPPQSRVAPVAQPHAATAPSSSKSSVLDKILEKSQGSRFRYLNEVLYTTSGDESYRAMQSDQLMFQQYHQGFQSQTRSWPVQPVDLAIRWIKQQRKDLQVADFGCGDARLAASVQQKVHSLDLVACAPGVIACNMAATPLGSASVDAAVFSLSLMGTDYGSFLVEAARVLRPRGWLWIAEVRSRFVGKDDQEDLTPLVKALQQLGFVLREQDTSNKMFVVLLLRKLVATRANPKSITWPPLRACQYKKR